MLKIDLNLCSGCKRCMLACSFSITGGFNPRYSMLEIKTDLGNKPISYSIRECSNCHKPYYCIDICHQKAIEADI